LTLQELVFLVVDWASNTLNLPIQDGESVVEDMLPTALQVVALKAAAEPRTESLLRRNFTVSLTNGTGTVSDNVLTSCWPGATVYIPGEPTVGPLMSYVPNWNDFIGPLDSRLGYWIFQSDSTIYWIDPNDTFDITSGRTGDIIMNIASVPSIPATETDDLDMPDELLSDLIAYMKDVLSKQPNARSDA
jgi:hypothetical protein